MLHGVVKVNFPSNLESLTRLEPLIKVKDMEGTVHSGIFLTNFEEVLTVWIEALEWTFSH